MVSAYPMNSYTRKYDNIVHWILKTNYGNFQAPSEIINSLQLGESIINTNFKNLNWNITIWAGKNKIITAKHLYHNQSDIMRLEIAVALIQNYRLQGNIKRTSHSINST